MFKPTKKQHVVNKAYADKNGGSGGGGTEPLIVSINGDGASGYALDRTWREIHDAFPNVILRRVSSDIWGEHEAFYSVINVREQGGPGKTTFAVESFQSSTAGFTVYMTYEPNGYPRTDGSPK